VAAALDHAHAQGVLHRDVKPSNLLLDARGTVWVADFGLAKAVGATADPHGLTQTGDLVGTLRYMAPERFGGECDARSDVYALGASLYELLALRPAFEDPDRLRLVEQIARGDPAPVRRLNPAVPRDLDTVVRKAMARRPADRYPTAAALAADLSRFLDGRPVLARRASALEVAWRWSRRRPAVAALSAAVLVLVAVTAGGGWWAASALRRQVAEVSGARRDTTDRLWEARLAQARAVRVSRLPGQRLKGLEAVAEAAGIRPSAELRNEACACLALYDVRTEREWDAPLESARMEYSTGATFDATLEHTAATDAVGTVTVRTAGGEEVARLAGSGFPADYLRFSPDGRYLAARYTSPARRQPRPAQLRPLRVWDWRTGRVAIDLPNTPQPMLSFDFHPSGTAVAVGDARRIDLYSLPDGRLVRSVALDFAPCWLAFQPGRGDRLAVCGATGLRVLGGFGPGGAWAPGHPGSGWHDLPTGLYAVAWRPDGRLLAASGQDGNIYTFRPDSGAAGTILRGHQLEARELAFTPDGSVLVTRGWDATTRFWDPVEGRELLRVRGASFLQVSRDGRRVGYRGYTTSRLGVWELVGGDVCRVLDGPDGLAPQVHAAVAFSPDGAALATAGAAGLTVWGVATGQVTDHRPLGVLTDVRFDPRGRWVYAAGPSTRSYRIPVGQEAGRWALGEPECWPVPAAQPFQFATDRTGDVVAVVNRFSRVQVIPARGRPVDLGGHRGVSFADVSPDGRWVATGPWRGEGVRVWRADGWLEKELPADETAGVGFSPDGGRLLVVESDGVCRAYAVGTWDLLRERRDPGTGFARSLKVAFHPDGRTMAHVHDRVALRVVDEPTGVERAVLPLPESHNLAAYAFSPDGRLVAAVTVSGAVQLWDLAALRDRLRGIGLDWPTGG
jgi:WD40 repeat protein